MNFRGNLNTRACDGFRNRKSCRFEKDSGIDKLRFWASTSSKLLFLRKCRGRETAVICERKITGDVGFEMYTNYDSDYKLFHDWK